jgi:hypothetical protein
VKLVPFVRVDDVAFSLTPEDLRTRKGARLLCGCNDVGLEEMDYGDAVFRFQASGRLEEVTKRASLIQLPQAAVPLPFLQGFLREHDPASFERGGFIVSPRFGFAYAPASPEWVTALAEHCIETWRCIR